MPKQQELCRMEIVPRQEPEAGAIVFAPKVETDNWLSVSPASASSVAAPPRIQPE